MAAPYAQSALAVGLDVTDAEARETAVEAALDRFGRIDVLANIAGRGSLGAVEEFSPEQLHSSAGVRSGKRPPTPAPRLSRSAAEARAMRPSSPIALVTGANRGIGFEVCRQLSESGMRVLLAARDPAKGEAAARTLAREGLAVEAVSLDVTEAASIQALHLRLATVDVLVNNAGVDYDTDQTALSADLNRVRKAFETISSAPGRSLRPLRPACVIAAGAGSSTSAAARGAWLRWGAGRRATALPRRP